jgi:hypothetical protein
MTGERIDGVNTSFNWAFLRTVVVAGTCVLDTPDTLGAKSPVVADVTTL